MFEYHFFSSLAHLIFIVGQFAQLAILSYCPHLHLLRRFYSCSALILKNGQGLFPRKPIYNQSYWHELLWPQIGPCFLATYPNFLIFIKAAYSC